MSRIDERGRESASMGDIDIDARTDLGRGKRARSGRTRQDHRGGRKGDMTGSGIADRTVPSTSKRSLIWRSELDAGGGT